MFSQEELNSLYRYCYTLNNDQDKAYDLLYAGIEKFLKYPPDNAKAKFSYIRRIIRNLWIDNYRKYTPEIELITPTNQESIGYLISEDNELESELMTSQELEMVWQKMSVEEREIIYLWIIERFSMDEIAKYLGKSKNTVISKIYRMRKRMRVEMPDFSFSVG